MWVVYRGIDSIRILLNIKAPLLIALGIVFLAWAYRAAGGFGPMLSQPSAFDPGQPKAGQFMTFFIPGPDRHDRVLGDALPQHPGLLEVRGAPRGTRSWARRSGLPLAMAFYSFIGVAVTSATVVIYGRTIWDPLEVLVQFRNPAVLLVAMLALCIATLATNIAANVVSPANDFSHLAPRRISFRIGGLITGLIGILIMPWKLVADPSGYIFTWLVGYSALLGPIGGIMIADYFVLRRMRLDVPGALRPARRRTAIRAAGASSRSRPSSRASCRTFPASSPRSTGSAPRACRLLPHIYGFAWFAGFAIAFVAYLVLRKLAPNS
jgi:NCS1 family nucleobase:cation symporter-1